jgi:hypothetical protein
MKPARQPGENKPSTWRAEESKKKPGVPAKESRLLNQALMAKLAAEKNRRRRPREMCRRPEGGEIVDYAEETSASSGG